MMAKPFAGWRGTHELARELKEVEIGWSREKEKKKMKNTKMIIYVQEVVQDKTAWVRSTL